jgi:hypothetical protein
MARTTRRYAAEDFESVAQIADSGSIEGLRPEWLASALRQGADAERRAARLEALEVSARAWWRSHRPEAMTQQQHWDHHRVNLVTEAEKALADALMALTEDVNG